VRILIDYRPALRERTGVGEYIHHLAQALATETEADPGTTVTLFSSSWRHRLAPDVVAGAEIVDRRVPVRCLNWLWHRAAWPPLEYIAGAHDIAHSPHPLLMPSRQAARFVTIHDLDFLAHPDRTAAEVRRDYPSLVARHANRADRVIVSSNYTASLVHARLGVPTDRIICCPSGAPAWSPRPEPNYDGHILVMGSLTPRKNLPTLVRAYRALLGRRPDTPDLVLAGSVPPGAQRTLGPIDTAPLAGKLRILGYVGPATRRALYAGASMLVMPSLDEGFGMPVLEAMTAGVPVIASTRGALPDLVGDVGLLVEPEDEAALAAAMTRMLDDRSFVDGAITRGLARARHYDWRAPARTLLRAYADVLHER
jgi:glycosyltransferase involved in cell wall biosynthesis|tara:strand:- start:3043 stop:4146 length:1104 start_codon:yes stop_codon:yes gene_type:complete